MWTLIRSRSRLSWQERLLRACVLRSATGSSPGLTVAFYQYNSSCLLCHWPNETSRVRKNASNLGQMNCPSIISHKGDEASGRTSLLFTFSLVTFAHLQRRTLHSTPDVGQWLECGMAWHGRGQGPGLGVLAHSSVESGQRYESRRGTGALRPMRTVKVDIEVTVWLWNTSALAFSRQNLPPNLKRMWRWKV